MYCLTAHSSEGDMSVCSQQDAASWSRWVSLQAHDTDWRTNTQLLFTAKMKEIIFVYILYTKVGRLDFLSHSGAGRVASQAPCTDRQNITKLHQNLFKCDHGVQFLFVQFLLLFQYKQTIPLLLHHLPLSLCFSCHTLQTAYSEIQHAHTIISYCTACTLQKHAVEGFYFFGLYLTSLR